ncbi:hypothetical protein NUW58_g7469 [Xylaria curta]|uniref:Uncharacterized protein n=1 Tax=Xylaria curta TaxID=42375 RepID=A0ACC1NHX2_9PEZI|nr:hypothetical protein NUW58_g7469 [Xylaria curta]
MDSTSSPDEINNYMLPSTFTPWNSDEPTDLPVGNTERTTTAHATRPRIGPATSVKSAYALAPSSTSRASLDWRASPDHFSSQPLSISPYTPLRELPNMQDSTTPPQTVTPSRSAGSAATTETISSLHSSETERQHSLHSVLSGPSSVTPMEQGAPAFSKVDDRRTTTIMSTHSKTESVTSPLFSPTPLPSILVSEDDGGEDNLSPRFANSLLGCRSRRDVYIKRWSWLYITLIALSIFTTTFSGLWFAVSIIQPQYGRAISTGKGWQILPSTATLLSALAAKTIELSFVTVFVAVLGQVLTRRAFSRHSRGVTLAEMTMRNWQPGSLLTHWEGISSAAATFLGALTLTATICTLFYTTASDAMVSPKLIRRGWDMRDLQGLVKTSYANPMYIKETCQTPLRDLDFDVNHTAYAEACLAVLFSGQSYQSLRTFMAEWDDVRNNKTSTVSEIAKRPTGKHNLFDNTTMDSSWIETDYGDVEANFNTYKRIINNVTLAMPHAGVYAAAMDPINDILQPRELLGLGEYSIKASVPSPVVNVMCVNMNEDELAPIVYTKWPHARTKNTTIQGQLTGVEGWGTDVSPGWRGNRTVVDDIFRWGERYNNRPPPVFQLYPANYNMVTNISWIWDDPLYILAKAPNTTDYTLCDLRSWMTPACFTSFNLSGTLGGRMKANCEDFNDGNTYGLVEPKDAAVAAQTDGRLAERGRGVAAFYGLKRFDHQIAQTARFALTYQLDPRRPPIAEAIAVLASNTLATGTIDSTFKLNWTYDALNNILTKTTHETFRAQVQTQQYASTHTESWQAIFYPVLGLTFVLNLDLHCIDLLVAAPFQ